MTIRLNTFALMASRATRQLAALSNSPLLVCRYKVVSVRPRSPEEAELVRAMVKRMALDQWTEPRAWWAAMDVMVSPRQTHLFLNGLRRRHIPATIKINDIQT